MRGLPITFALLQLSVGYALAQQDEAPVEVLVQGLFGDDLLLPDGYAELVVTLTSRSRRDLSGELRVEVKDWQNPTEVYQLRVDLPARSERRVQVPVYLRQSGAEVRAIYTAGAEFRSQMLTVGYNGAREGLVVLADPPRLRGALLDLIDEQADLSAPYHHGMDLSVGVVTSDPETGDPIAPTSVVGWRGVSLAVASAPDLERLTPPQQQALRDWLRVGGELLVFPRTPEDIRAPLLRTLVGPVEWSEGPTVAVNDYERMVPPAAQGRGFSLPSGSLGRFEPFGASFPVGFGRVFLASYNGANEPLVDAPETRRTIDSILHRDRGFGQEPMFVFGGADDSSGGLHGSVASFHQLRRALDPNESFRPALLLVALVLVVYILVVGPVNFAYVARKNRPLLALLTTPAVAAIFLLLLLFFGYLGKGTTMRYRAASLLELVEGDGEGPRRQYLALFLVRPTTFDLPAARRGATRLLFEGRLRRPLVQRAGDEVTLRGLRGTLWDTLFVREEAIASIQGRVVFERNGQNLAMVRNESGTPLEGAVVIDPAGGVYPVGDVPAGGTARIAGSPTLTLRGDVPSFYGSRDPELLGLAQAMGLPPKAARALGGLAEAAGCAMVADLPTLWARVPSSERPIAGRFVPESELHLVRVIPRVEGAPISIDGGGSGVGVTP